MALTLFLSLRSGIFFGLVELELVSSPGLVTHFVTFDAWRMLFFIGGGRSMQGMYAAGVIQLQPADVANPTDFVRMLHTKKHICRLLEVRRLDVRID